MTQMSCAEATTAPDLRSALIAEGIGTALLLATVVGSGIMAERLAAGNDAVALLANAIATGAALVALIVAFGPISGAHFNPLVTAVLTFRRGHDARRLMPYVVVQCFGAVGGVALANVMFGGDAFEPSTHMRSGFAQLLSEAVATFGLLLVVVLSNRMWCKISSAPSVSCRIRGVLASERGTTSPEHAMP